MNDIVGGIIGIALGCFVVVVAHVIERRNARQRFREAMKSLRFRP